MAAPADLDETTVDKDDDDEMTIAAVVENDEPTAKDNQAKRWCFAWNNCADDDTNLIKNAIDSNWFKCIVYGKETAPTTGTPHLQGFFVLNDKKRLNFIKNAILQSDKISLRISRAKDPSKAADCCRKGEQSKSEWEQCNTKGPNFGRNAMFEEAGSLESNQGKRPYLLVAKMKLDEGCKVEEL